MDASNIEVALKNDHTDQENISSKEVFAGEPRAAEGASKPCGEFDSQGGGAEFDEQHRESENFISEVPVADQGQEDEQEIFVTEDTEPEGQQETTVLVQGLQDLESVVVDDVNQLRVLEGTTTQSFPQLQHLKQSERIPERQPQTTPSYPFVQSYHPVYFQGVNSLPGEVLQVINPVQPSPLEQGGGGRSSQFIQSADLYRLVRMFPDFHSKTLHRILACCHGDLKRAIDQTLFARQLRVIDLGPPYPQQPHLPVHSAHHPYRVPRGAFPGRTHSPFILYPESPMEGYGSPVATQRRPTIAQTQPQPPSGVLTPNAGTPIMQTLPSFQSVFVPVYQKQANQVPESSRLVVPDVIVPDGMSGLHVVKLEQLNSTGVSDQRQDRFRITTELESTIPMSVTSAEAIQPNPATVRSISEDGVLDVPTTQTESSTDCEVNVSAEKLDIGGSGDGVCTASSLLANMADMTSDSSIISH